MFKDNYAGKYDKDEFLIDAGMEFFKIKKLLSKNPKLLKDDLCDAVSVYALLLLILKFNFSYFSRTERSLLLNFVAQGIENFFIICKQLLVGCRVFISLFYKNSLT